MASKLARLVAKPQEDGGAEDDGGSPGGLAACAPHASIAGLCILPVDDAFIFTNCSPPLQAKIVAVGKAEARVECFGSGNFGAAIPVAAHPEEQPVIPEETVWWRVENEDGAYTVALAASGVESLNARVGDSVSIRHAVVWGGWDAPRGNAEVDIAGRGHVLIAINDSSLLNVSDGAAYCERPGACGGQEWTMRIDVDGEPISVPPFESIQVGKSRFTNAGAFTHRSNYVEPGEAAEGTPGCKGEPRTNFVATRVDTL